MRRELQHAMPVSRLDATDIRILAALQDDASLTNVDLARRVGLSPSPCLARVRALEESEVILRRVTLLDPVKLGASVSVFIQVTLEKQTEPVLEAFEAAMASFPEVMECYLMTGSADYLVRVVARDVDDLERIHSTRLTRLAGVSRVTSSISMRQVVRRAELPVR